jgi:outer membrane protein assembly factor BamD (BamD/ComL family)
LVEAALVEHFAFKPKQANAWATFLVGLSRGFLLDWVATKDTERIQRSIDAIVKLIDGDTTISKKRSEL